MMNVGLETSLWSSQSGPNPLGKKGKHSDNSLLPSELPGIVKSGPNFLMGSSQSPATAVPLALGRTMMRSRRSGFHFVRLNNISKPPLTFSLLPWTPTPHSSRGHSDKMNNTLCDNNKNLS